MHYAMMYALDSICILDSSSLWRMGLLWRCGLVARDREGLEGKKTVVDLGGGIDQKPLWFWDKIYIYIYIYLVAPLHRSTHTLMGD